MIRYKPRATTKWIILHDSHTAPSVATSDDYLRRKGRSMGLLDVGYHYVIDREGKVIETRPPEQIGSHTPGYNLESIGICLLGGRSEEFDCRGEPFVEDNFTPPQRKALMVLLLDLSTRYPEAEIVAHTDLQRFRSRKFACPCIDVATIKADLAVINLTGRTV